MDDWILLDLDPLAAARAGLPEQVAVPAHLDASQATPDELVRYAELFASAEPDHPLTPELRRLVAKQRPQELARAALADRRWDDALAQVDAVLAIDPQDAPARLNRAAALREAGDPQAALAELDAVARVFADVALFHRNRGRVLEDLGDAPRAIAAYREALDLVPGDPAVVERLRALGALTTVSGPDGPIEVDREALADLVRRDLALHDDDHGHLSTAARSLLAEGQPDLAATAAALALAEQDDDEAMRLVLIEALLAAERPAEALEAADRHLEAVPASASGHEQRAVALARVGRDDEARAAARRALELDPAAPLAGRIAAGDVV
ncbi:MAG: tetratricopeptide repeat protein [Gaiellales bacterium]